LTEYINESRNLSDAAIATNIPNLFVLPRGRSNSASSELFLTSRFDQLLKEAVAEFKYVILDSIPVFAADDATTLAPNPRRTPLQGLPHRSRRTTPVSVAFMVSSKPWSESLVNWAD